MNWKIVWSRSGQATRSLNGGSFHGLMAALALSILSLQSFGSENYILSQREIDCSSIQASKCEALKKSFVKECVNQFPDHRNLVFSVEEQSPSAPSPENVHQQVFLLRCHSVSVNSDVMNSFLQEARQR